MNEINSENYFMTSKPRENFKEIQKVEATTATITKMSTSTQKYQKNNINAEYNRRCKENFLKECQKVADDVALNCKFAFVKNFN